MVPVIARNGKGCNQLANKITGELDYHMEKDLVYYGREVNEAIIQMTNMLGHSRRLSPRWLTLQLLKGNQYVRCYLTKSF